MSIKITLLSCLADILKTCSKTKLSSQRNGNKNNEILFFLVFLTGFSKC